jgi:hypothetical protein
MKVYILNTHEEHGPYHIVATLDRDRIISLIQEKFTDIFPDEVIKEAVNNATELLRVADPDGTGYMSGLNKRWGGIQLHVVDLEGGIPWRLT